FDLGLGCYHGLMVFNRRSVFNSCFRSGAFASIETAWLALSSSPCRRASRLLHSPKSCFFCRLLRQPGFGSLLTQKQNWRLKKRNQREPTGAARHTGFSGEQMASPNTYSPSREDFKALLEESYGESEAIEGSVIKGKVVGIEKDVAV